jgi:hypothetical protein
VEDGGEFLLVGGGTQIGQGGDASDTNYWLWVQSGGVVNLANNAGLNLYGILTNSGVINVSNNIDVLNNGSAGYDGGLYNLAGGVIDLWDNAGISGGYGYDYLVNQGTISLSSGTGASSVALDNVTNSGTLSAQHGTLQLQGTHLILQPSETLSVGLNSASDYGKIALIANVTSPGAFSAHLNNGYIPTTGDTFNVLSCTSLSGSFNGFSLPAASVAFQAIISTNAMSLLVQPLIALFQETNLVFNANGTPGSQAVLLSSTNVAVALTNWVPVATNTFDAAAYFSYTNNMLLNKPQEFFIQKLQ